MPRPSITPAERVSNIGALTDNKREAAARLDRLAAGAGVSFLGKAIGRGTEFAKQIVMARLLGGEVFGLYALAWNLLRIVGILSPLGLQFGVTRFGTPYCRQDPARFKSVLRNSLWLALGVSTLAGVGLYWLAPWLGTEVFGEPALTTAFRWFLPILPFMAGLRVAAAATRISQRMQYGVYAEELAQTGVNLVLFVLLYLAGARLLGAVWSTVLSFAVAFVLALFYLRRLYPQLRGVRVKAAVSRRALLAYSAPTALAGMFGLLVYRLDKLFLGYFWSAADVGVYQAASVFAIVLAVILDSVNAVFVPIIAELHYANKRAELEELYRVSTKWGIYSGVPVVLVLLFASRDAMVTVFGEEYAAGALPLVILMAGQFINAATGAAGSMLVMTGHQRRWLALSGAALVLNVVLNLVLVPRYAAVGAAIATATSIAFLFLSGVVQAKRVVGLWPYDWRYGKGLVATGLAVVAVAAFRAVIDGPAWLMLCGTAAVSVAVFAGALAWLGLDREDRVLFALVRKKLGPAS